MNVAIEGPVCPGAADRYASPRMRWLLLSVGLATALGLGFLVGWSTAGGSGFRFGAGRSEVLATFEGGTIDAALLKAEIAELGARTAAQPQAARALLDEAVDRALLAREARKAGYDADPAVQLRYAQMLAVEYHKRNIEGPAQAVYVSDADVRAAFEAQRPSLTLPERVRVAYLVLAIPPGQTAPLKSDAARLLAEVKREMTRSRNWFENVARSRDSQGRLFGGEFPYLGREELAQRAGPPVANAAFALEQVGDFTPSLVAGSDGLYFLRLLGRQSAQVPRFEDFSDRIRSQLLAQRRQEFEARWLDELRRAAAVKVDEAALGRFAEALKSAPP